MDSVGRSQLSEGNDEEAHSTYQKVLAISYQQGSLKGIGTALLALSEIAERGDHQGEALGIVTLLSKMVEALGNEEKEVMELRLARLLEQQNGIEMQMTGILAEEAEDGPEPTPLASESEAATPPASDSTDRETLLARPTPENPEVSRFQQIPESSSWLIKSKSKWAGSEAFPLANPLSRSLPSEKRSKSGCSS